LLCDSLLLDPPRRCSPYVSYSPVLSRSHGFPFPDNGVFPTSSFFPMGTVFPCFWPGKNAPRRILFFARWDLLFFLRPCRRFTFRVTILIPFLSLLSPRWDQNYLRGTTPGLTSKYAAEHPALVRGSATPCKFPPWTQGLLPFSFRPRPSMFKPVSLGVVPSSGQLTPPGGR